MSRQPRVTLDETPSETLAQEGAAEVVVSDARGRKLTLRNPGVLAQFRVVKVVGPALAENQVYMQMVLPLLYVSAIDGEILAQPTSDDHIEALIQRLDEAGITAVLEGVQANFARDAEATKAATKK